MTTEEQAANTFTLDDVYNQMTEWRNNKEKLGFCRKLMVI